MQAFIVRAKSDGVRVSTEYSLLTALNLLVTYDEQLEISNETETLSYPSTIVDNVVVTLDRGNVFVTANLSYRQLYGNLYPHLNASKTQVVYWSLSILRPDSEDLKVDGLILSSRDIVTVFDNLILESVNNYVKDV